jgi:uncharacterized protein YjbI with pentapeptide repeats
MLSRCDLTETNLSQARLMPVELKRRDGQSTGRLWSTNLTGAKLCRARLIKSSLNAAVLRGADLTEADFSGATLRGADLDAAEVAGAQFDSADLADAKLPPTLRR